MAHFGVGIRCESVLQRIWYFRKCVTSCFVDWNSISPRQHTHTNQWGGNKTGYFFAEGWIFSALPKFYIFLMSNSKVNTRYSALLGRLSLSRLSHMQMSSAEALIWHITSSVTSSGVCYGQRQVSPEQTEPQIQTSGALSRQQHNTCNSSWHSTGTINWWPSRQDWRLSTADVQVCHIWMQSMALVPWRSMSQQEVENELLHPMSIRGTL